MEITNKTKNRQFKKRLIKKKKKLSLKNPKVRIRTRQFQCRLKLNNIFYHNKIDLIKSQIVDKTQKINIKLSLIKRNVHGKK